MECEAAGGPRQVMKHMVSGPLGAHGLTRGPFPKMPSQAGQRQSSQPSFSEVGADGTEGHTGHSAALRQQRDQPLQEVI